MIRTGIGGWTFPGWRNGFYPPGLRHDDELAFASRRVAAIEINATYHRLHKPEHFRQWRSATPDGFVFAVKGSRFVTNRRELASAGEALARFLGQGLAELGDRLGPLVWQLMATKRFDPDDVGSFLALLPPALDGLPLRHVVEAGHPSFACAEFVRLARTAGVAICYAEAAGREAIADQTAPFAYARLQGMQSDLPTGYGDEDLDRLAAMAACWESGEAPRDLPYADERAASIGYAGDVFVFMINGAKERAPAAAVALAERLAAP